jgi:hypothetical protein
LRTSWFKSLFFLIIRTSINAYISKQRPFETLLRSKTSSWTVERARGRHTHPASCIFSFHSSKNSDFPLNWSVTSLLYAHIGLQS